MIIQISRVQMRRGLQENLPQLASAEIGWALDTRKLYIGNGLIEEGAPELGNTEILTTHSDIFSLSGVYTFKGLAAGYTVQTGPSNLAPVFRSMQDKFDDSANIRDFGAVGDGVTNDVDAFNRAIEQLYKSTILSDETRVRRTLYIPAGTYNLTGDWIRLLPFVKLKGDGKNSTFIVQADLTQHCVLGSTSEVIPGVVPGQFEVEDLTLYNITDNHIVDLDSVTDVFFDRVRMKGIKTLPTSPDLLKACVNVRATISPNSAFAFNNCEFIGQSYGFYANDRLTDVNITGSIFSNLYSGVNLGEGNVGFAHPDSVRITHSFFDFIAAYGIFGASTLTGVSNVVSAFNTFNNVGNMQTNTPASNVIKFGGDNCYSLGDMFDRASNAAIPAVNLDGHASFATLTDGRFLLGKQLTASGRDAVLPDNTTAATPAGIIGVGDKPTIVEYTLIRDVERRIGTLKISAVGTTLIYDDDYVETDNLGIVLTPVLTGGVIELQYVTSFNGFDSILKTASRTLI